MENKRIFKATEYKNIKERDNNYETVHSKAANNKRHQYQLTVINKKNNLSSKSKLKS